MAKRALLAEITLSAVVVLGTPRKRLIDARLTLPYPKFSKSPYDENRVGRTDKPLICHLKLVVIQITDRIVTLRRLTPHR